MSDPTQQVEITVDITVGSREEAEGTAKEYGLTVVKYLIDPHVEWPIVTFGGQIKDAVWFMHDNGYDVETCDMVASP